MAIVVTAACSDSPAEAPPAAAEQPATDRPGVGATAAGTSQPPQRLAVPLEGVWTVGNGPTLAICYVISLNEESGRGSILVETSPGVVLREHEFEVTDPDSIRIHGARRGPYDAAALSADQLIDVIRLKDPPAELRFSSEAPSLPDLSKEDGMLFCDGLLDALPIPVPLKRIPDTQRLAMALEDVVADLDVQIPPGTVAKIQSDEPVVPWGLTALVFEEPVHPLGHVRSLHVQGWTIELEDTELRDGMLSTRQFGPIELLMLGTGGNIELRATWSQIREIRDWLFLNERRDMADLLRLDTANIIKVVVNDYWIDVDERRLVNGQVLELTRDDVSSEWSLRGLGATETLDVSRLDGMMSTFKALPVVDLDRKPAGLITKLSGDDKLQLEEEDVASLARHGFYVAEGRLLSRHGETTVGLSSGVQYILRFGDTAGVRRAGGLGGSGEPSKAGAGRYVFITAGFEPGLAREGDPDSGEQRVAALNERFAEWYFVLPTGACASLRPSSSDLVQPR